MKSRWVYRTKFTSEGVFEHHKYHLVVKGFSQQEGIDYNKTLFPYCKYELYMTDCFRDYFFLDGKSIRWM
jgi:hypothetical protein